MSVSGLVATTTRTAPPPPRPDPSRRRWWLAAGGVVILAGSITGVQTYVLAQNQTTPVLVLARDVSWGHQLGGGDLAVADVLVDERVPTIGADQRERVVGQIAAHTLTAGSLLTQAGLTADRVPGPGQLVVGVLLKPGGIPARGAHPGDAVLLTPTASAGDTAASVAAVRGTALDAGPAAADGSVTVDVVVDAAQRDIAAPAGAGQVVLSLLGGIGR